LIFANPGALTASMSISGSGLVIKRSAGALTLSGTQTYTNLTMIEAGTLEFAGTPPQGDITNNSVLGFRPSAATTYAGKISGPGMVTVSASGGTLTLSGANTFSGGINLTAGNLELAHNNAAGTGNVTNAGSGCVYVGSGVVITNGFALPTSTTDLNMRCDNGTGVWAGDIVYMGSGASWRPGSDGSGTLVFTGRAIQGTRNFIVPRGTMHFASNAYVSATGPATALGRDATDGNRSARIVIRDNAVLELGPCSMGGGRQGGYITLTIQDNAVLSTGTNNFDLHNVNRATATNTIRLNGGTFVTGGFIKTRSTYTNAIWFNGGLLRASMNNSAFLPAFANQTALVQSGGARIDDAGFAITIAQPLIHDPALGAALDGGLTKLGTGVLTLTGSNTYNGPTRIMAGSLALAGAGAIPNTTNIYVAAGAALDVTGTPTGSLALGYGRALWGNGTVYGNVAIGPGAWIAPGSNAIGRLTINGNLTLAAGSTNLFELRSGPVTNDVVAVTGALALGGTLIVTNTAAEGLKPGDTFKLFDAAGYTGAFASIALPQLTPPLAWDTNQLSTAGIIRVISLGPPLIESVRLEGTNLVLTGSGGNPGAFYRVLTSTNVALPRNAWVPLLTNQFFAEGRFALTNPVSPGMPQQFYTIETLAP
ncbi:MAG: autotransporter-associated beta strand repeat-containing protein, partial [Verrucomicrobiales bacterium]|nr:autotransporter-associated beta strand repeat-containing protein [Verrucomicrobiales bacterium]